MKNMPVFFALLFAFALFAAGCASSQNDDIGSDTPGPTGTASGEITPETSGAGDEARDPGAEATTPGEGSTTLGTTDADRGDPRTGSTTPEGEPRNDVTQTDAEAQYSPSGTEDASLRGAILRTLEEAGLETVDASVDQGIVTLTGTAASETEFERAVALIRKINGVREVNSQVTINQQ